MHRLFGYRGVFVDNPVNCNGPVTVYGRAVTPSCLSTDESATAEVLFFSRSLENRYIYFERYILRVMRILILTASPPESACLKLLFLFGRIVYGSEH